MWRYHDEVGTLLFYCLIAAYAALAANLFKVAALEFYFQPRKVLFLTARGVKDLRISPEEIPWRDIEKIRDEDAQINPGIILEMNPAKRANLKMAKGFKRIYSRDRGFATFDLLVMTTNLRADRAELLATMQRLWAAARALDAERVSEP